MIQIIGWLLCFYLVVKGFEFRHRSQCSAREDERGEGLGTLMFVFCIIGAAFFAWMLLEQGSDPALRSPVLIR